jgi:hypothetical protein
MPIFAGSNNNKKTNTNINNINNKVNSIVCTVVQLDGSQITFSICIRMNNLNCIVNLQHIGKIV